MTVNPNASKRVIILTSQSVSDVEYVARPLRNKGYSLNVIQAVKDQVDFITEPDNFNTVILCIQNSHDGDWWQDVINDTKNRDPYSELILEVIGDSIDPGQVLLAGYFGYFQREYSIDVLIGYIEAAERIIHNRKRRFVVSSELNKSARSVKDAVNEIAVQLKQYLNYDRITIALLSERDYIPADDPVNKAVRTLVYYDGYDKAQISWWLLRPLRDDTLIQQLLRGGINQSVFPNVEADLKEHGWDTANGTKSWVFLPLRYLGQVVGIITADGLKRKQFNYGNVSEVTLQQFANQAALTILSAQQSDASTRLSKALSAVASEKNLDRVLSAIAEQACKLVDGLYSYVVVPDRPEKKLEFKGAWSASLKQGILQVLQEHVKSFDIPVPGNPVVPDQGITPLAYQRQKTVILDDCLGVFRTDTSQSSSPSLQKFDADAYKAYKDFQPAGQEKPTRSNIAIPIIDESEKTTDGKNRILGVINVEHEYPCAFTSIQIETLQTFAKFASISIKSASARERIVRLYSADTTPILNAKRRLGEQLNLGTLAQVAEDATGADGGVKIFARVDERTTIVGQSRSATVTDVNRGTRGNEGHTLWVIQQAEASLKRPDPTVFRFCVPNIAAYRREDGGGFEINPATTRAHHLAIACLPLCYNGRVLGAMWLHYTKPQQFTEEELNELQVYANRAALMIYFGQEAALLQLSERIGKLRGKDEATEIANIIVNYVKDQFGVKGVIFYRNYPPLSELKMVAVTQDPDGSDHIDHNRAISHGQGIAGNHILAREKDGINYQNISVPIEDYSQVKHNIPEDARLNKLHSLLSIRLESPLTKKKVGILILNDDLGRTYNQSTSDIEKFALLAANLLVNVDFPNQKRQIRRWIGTFLALAILASANVIATLLIQDPNLPELVKGLFILVVVVTLILFTIYANRVSSQI